MKTIIKHSVLLLFFVSCAASMSTFDQYAYTQTTSLKVDALNLMDKATDSYSNHITEITEVRIKFQKAYEYEKNRPKNETTATMWQLMMNDSSLYYGFLKLWESEERISPAVIQNAKKLVSDNFDRIAQLESKKIKTP